MDGTTTDLLGNLGNLGIVGVLVAGAVLWFLFQFVFRGN